MSIKKILTGSALTVMTTEHPLPFSLAREHKFFDKLLEAIRNSDEAAINDIIDLASKVRTYSDGKVRVEDGVVYVGDEEVHNVLAERIVELMSQGIDYSFMARFLENLMQNPSYQSRQELYLFLENGNCPITDDGRFIAFKWVRDDYKDCHSGTFDNSVGQIVKMERRDVDDNRSVTCSAGLHVCTENYTKFGSKLMLAAVNPRDVVSVPNDYNNAKMRVCEYEIVKEVSPDDYKRMTEAMIRVKDEAVELAFEEEEEDDNYGDDDDNYYDDRR